jgi:hypothetical protein
MSSVYASTGRRRLRRIARADRNKAVALCPWPPFDTARWAGDEQYGQHHQWSGDKRENECPEKTHAAVAAAKSREDTED